MSGHHAEPGRDGVLRRMGTAALVCFSATMMACGATGSAAAPTPAPHRWTGAVLVHAIPKPSFVLTDDHGVPFDFRADTAGKVTLLYFGYTHCPDVCPQNMAAVALALRGMPSAVRPDVSVVFVTTDPARDTGPVLAAWLANFNAGFIGLTGSTAQVQLAQFQSQVSLASLNPTQSSGGYLVDHAAQVIAYSPDNLAHVLFFQGMAASDIARDLVELATHPWTGS